MKIAILKLLSAVLFLFSAVNSSQDFTLVKQGDWGTSTYKEVVNINGLYFISQGSSSDVIVLDREKEAEASLIARLKLDNGNNYSSSIGKYHGYLVYLSNNELGFYDIDDLNDVKKVYSVNVGNVSFDKQRLLIADKVYVINGNNQIYAIDYANDSFEIVKVIDALESIDFTDMYMQSRTLVESEDQIILIATTYHSVTHQHSIHVERFERDSLVTIDSYEQPNINFYGGDIAAIDPNRFVLVIDGKLQTIVLENGTFSLLENFPSVYSGTESIIFSDGKLWLDYQGTIRSYIIDANNNTRLWSLVNVTSDNYFQVYSISKQDNMLYFVSLIHGLSELTLTSTDHIDSWNNTMNFGSSKGAGVFVDNIYYFPTHESDRLIGLDTTQGGFITQVSIAPLPSSADQIRYVNDRLLMTGYNYMSFFNINEQGKVNTISALHSGVGSDNVVLGDKLYDVSGYPSAYLKEYDLSATNNIYKSPLTSSLPTVEHICIEDIAGYNQYVLVVNGCSNYEAYLFKGELGEAKQYLKTLNFNDYGGYGFKIISTEQFVYIVNQAGIFKGIINDEHDFELQEQISNYFSGGILDVALWNGNLIVISNTDMSVFNLSDTGSPILSSQLPLSGNSYGAKVITSKNNIIVNDQTTGVISFFQANLAPVVASSFDVNEDTVFNLSELINDPEGDDFSITVLTEAMHGIVDVEKENIYTPNENYYGEDSFEIRISDIHGNQVEQTITVNIIAVNDAPKIGVTEIVTNEDQNITINLEINDVEGDSFSFAITEHASHGSASLNDSGDLTYQPSTDYFGDDALSIKVIDSSGSSIEQKINITVNSVNDLPNAVMTEFEIAEDTTLEAKLEATDNDGTTVSFSIVGDSAVGGSASITSDGQFTFIPTIDFFGIASFRVNLEDDASGIKEELIIVNVMPVNDAPVAESISQSLSHNSSYSGSLPTTDIDGDTLAYSLVEDVTSGSLSLADDGSYSYSPNSGFSGTDSFTFKVSDGVSESQGTISFSVASAPVITTPKSSSGGSGGGSIHILSIFTLIYLIVIRRKRNIH